MRNVGLWIMNFGLWSPELAREETVVVSPACRQAGESTSYWFYRSNLTKMQSKFPAPTETSGCGYEYDGQSNLPVPTETSECHYKIGGWRATNPKSKFIIITMEQVWRMSDFGLQV